MSGLDSGQSDEPQSERADIWPLLPPCEPKMFSGGDSGSVRRMIKDRNALPEVLDAIG